MGLMRMLRLCSGASEGVDGAVDVWVWWVLCVGVHGQRSSHVPRVRRDILAGCAGGLAESAGTEAMRGLSHAT